jgi:hypothetical protein
MPRDTLVPTMLGMTMHSIYTTSRERTFDPVQHDDRTFVPRHPLHLGLLFALCGGRPPGAYAVLAPTVRLLAQTVRRAAQRLAFGQAGQLSLRPDGRTRRRRPPHVVRGVRAPRRRARGA